MKNIIYIALLCFAVCASLCSCDKDDDDEMIVDETVLYLDLFKPENTNLKVEYSQNSYRTEIPAEGGIYSFTFDKNAYMYYTFSGRTDPLRYFMFNLDRALEPIGNGDYDIIDNTKRETSLHCFFVQYESYFNGFTITVEPNISGEDRTMILEWMNFPTIAHFEITQLSE